MNDLISRQQATKEMYDLCERLNCESLHIDVIVDALENLPSAEPEQKKGKWIDDGTEFGCCCSECGTTLDDYFDGALYEICLNKIPNFCPSCGSYNGGEQE